jgi:hypothetical protein
MDNKETRATLGHKTQNEERKNQKQTKQNKKQYRKLKRSQTKKSNNLPCIPVF